MNPLLTEDLVRLSEIMRTMIDHASIGDWASLTRLDKQRREILNFDNSEKFRSDAEIKTHADKSDQTNSAVGSAGNDAFSSNEREILITEIYALDTQIMNAVQTNRQRLIDENRGLKAQIKAQEVYARASLMT